MGKVVGVGGVFLKAKDPKSLKAWYVANLGITISDWGGISFEGPEAAGTTALEFFPESKFQPGGSDQQAIVNFRVDSLDEVLAQLEAAGARLDQKQESADFGNFGWFWDPEGNRVELWEPVEE